MNQWQVYGLVSPRSGRVFYVGMTSDLKSRLHFHSSTQSASAVKSAIQSLRDQGMNFGYCIFGVFDDKQHAETLEFDLITLLPNLCNSDYNWAASDTGYDQRNESWGLADDPSIPTVTPLKGRSGPKFDKAQWQREMRLRKRMERETGVAEYRPTKTSRKIMQVMVGTDPCSVDELHSRMKSAGLKMLRTNIPRAFVAMIASGVAEQLPEHGFYRLTEKGAASAAALK